MTTYRYTPHITPGPNGTTIGLSFDPEIHAIKPIGILDGWHYVQTADRLPEQPKAIEFAEVTLTRELSDALSAPPAVVVVPEPTKPIYLAVTPEQFKSLIAYINGVKVFPNARTTTYALPFDFSKHGGGKDLEGLVGLSVDRTMHYGMGFTASDRADRQQATYDVVRKLAPDAKLIEFEPSVKADVGQEKPAAVKEISTADEFTAVHKTIEVSSASVESNRS